MAEIAEDQQVVDQNTGEVKMKDETVTNGEVETLGAQDGKVSASGDAPASRTEAEDTTEAVANDTEDIEQKYSETTAERTKPDEAEIDKKDNETEAKEEEEDPDWVDILGTGHLKKKVLCEGQGMDTRPERGQLVTIRSSGQVEGGGQVDCNEEIQFVLGDGDVVQGKGSFNMNFVNI